MRPRPTAGHRTRRRDRRSESRPAAADTVTSAHVDAALEVMATLGPASAVSLRTDPDRTAVRADRSDAGSSDVRRDHLCVEVCELPPDPRCGGAGLFTLEAPPGSLFVGVSFLGDPTPDAADPGSLGDDPDPVRIGPGPVRIDVVVTAAGEIRSQVHRGDGIDVVGGDAGGVLVDGLHRMLGLPSPGRPPALSDLVAGMWLHDVLRRSTDGSVPAWGQVAWAALDPVTPTGRSAVPPSEETIAAGMQELADGASWEDLRRAAAIGQMRVPELDPDEAEWMDATMFARWMVDSVPRPAVVVAHLEHLGAFDLAGRITSVLGRLSVPA